MTDIVIIVLLVVILGSALFYMKKEKAKGVTCIGCPDADICAKRRNGMTCQDKGEENM